MNGVTPGRDGQPGDAGIGDPAFILLVPVEQYRDAYVVFVPENTMRTTQILLHRLTPM